MKWGAPAPVHRAMVGLKGKLYRRLKVSLDCVWEESRVLLCTVWNGKVDESIMS